MTDLAAGDAADRAAGTGADARLTALELHRTHRVDRRHTHGLLPARFVLAVDVARFMSDAAGEQRRQR